MSGPFHVIHKGGEDRVLIDPALLTSTSPRNSGVLVFGEGEGESKLTLVPKADWFEVDYSKFVRGIHDQDGVGQCNLSATAGTMEVLREMAGMEYVELSAAYMYWKVNRGNNYNRGTLLEDGLEE